MLERAAVDGATFHAIGDRTAWEESACGVRESFALRVGGMERILAVAASGGEAAACR